MSYHDVLKGLTGDAKKLVNAAFLKLRQGKITDAQFVQLASGIVARANVQATALAEQSLAATLTQKTADVSTTFGLPAVTADQDRLAKGFETLLTDWNAGGDIDNRLERFAASEPYTTAQLIYTEGIKTSHVTEGWTRRLDAGACQLCRWWWRDGRVWPKDHYFQTHKGCGCTPEPVVGIARPTSFTEKGMRTDDRHREGWNDGRPNRAPSF